VVLFSVQDSVTHHGARGFWNYGVACVIVAAPKRGY
jgi:hypothetical protein